MNGTLLIVEDEEGIRELLTDYLSSMDFTVYAAESGQRALELITLHRSEVQLILSDNMMPGGMSGIDFLREARKLGITTPALLFSAVMPKNIAELQKDLNILQIVFKPVELDRLHSEICNALK